MLGKTGLCFALALSLPIALGAQGKSNPPNGNPGGPPFSPTTAERTVDCDAGDSLGAALAVDVLELTVDFTGTCAEDVTIDRDHTTLASDGSGVIEGSLTVRGASNVQLSDFTVSNGRGLRIMDSSAVQASGITSIDNPLGLGVRVEGSSNATLIDVTATNNLFANIAAINNGHILLLGTATASGASSVGLFVAGSGELDSRAVSVQADGNGFAGVAVQGGGTARFNTISASGNGFIGLSVLGGAHLFIGGGTVDGHGHGVDLDTGASAELNNLTVNGGGVAVLGGSSLRAANLTVTGAPNPDFGAGVAVQSSHLLLLGGSIDGPLALAEGGEASFGNTPVTLNGGLTCHPTAIAYAGQSCPP